MSSVQPLNIFSFARAKFEGELSFKLFLLKTKHSHFLLEWLILILS